MATLKEKYRSEIAPALKEELGLSNMMEVPRITKITLNMGVGEAVGDKKVMENALSDMTKIAGQKPIVTKSRKSIAGFKIRDGWPIGCKVTLRDERMYEFLDRLIGIAIPRIRDFRGSKLSFLRSTTIRLTRCVVWILRLQRRQKMTIRAVRCYVHLISRSKAEG